MTVNKITSEKRNKIINKSVNPLPVNPSRAGYKANEVKHAMFGFVTDESDSVLEEVNRVVDEVNECLQVTDNKFDNHYSKDESDKLLADKANSSEIPSSYIKDAVVDNSVLKLTKNDDTEVDFIGSTGFVAMDIQNGDLLLHHRHLDDAKFSIGIDGYMRVEIGG